MIPVAVGPLLDQVLPTLVLLTLLLFLLKVADVMLRGNWSSNVTFCPMWRGSPRCYQVSLMDFISAL